MVKKLLRSIRQKPKAVREQYAFWIACTLTSVIAMVWVLTLFDPINTTVESNDVEVVESSSLSDFMQTAKDQLDVVQDEVQNVLPSNTSEVTASSSATTTSTTSVETPERTMPVVESRQEIRIATTTSSSSAN